MSLHTSVIAIRGNRRDDVTEILERCKYHLIGAPAVYDDVDDAWDDLTDDPEERMTVKKLAYFDGGWTFIVDHELVMLFDDDAWIHFSNRWQTRILGWICEGASCTYAIAVFDNGKKIRETFSSDGELHTDEGLPLPEEEGVDWTSPYEDDVLAIAERMGAPLGCSDSASEKRVYLLDESEFEVT